MFGVSQPKNRCALLIATCLFGSLSVPTVAARVRQPPIIARIKPVIERDGLRFRDLNRNGVLDRYEDWRLSPPERARDLVGRMTLAEKAATMVHPAIPTLGNPFAATAYDEASARGMIEGGVTTFVTRITTEPAGFARANNGLQQLAEATRLGIPLTISSDPRNHFGSIFGASNAAGSFSRWPATTGFAAIGDPEVTRSFADVARREYRAVGITETLSPQADLATEPRWPRIDGTFGEDPRLAARLVAAYVAGFQGSADGLTHSGVLSIVKHWVGYGAQIDGLDSHNYYGRFETVTERSLKIHIEPFQAAFAVKAGGIMPTYSILRDAKLSGRPIEQVGGGFNVQLIDGLLRKTYGYQGIVLSDWEIVKDCPSTCRGAWQPGTPPSIGMPWGMENASVADRYAKAINAGVDQIGGAEDFQPIIEGVTAGKIALSKVDESVTRLLIPKFAMGLFEDPYVDPAEAARIVGNPTFTALAESAQRRSMVILEAKKPVALSAGTKVFLFGVAPDAARRIGLVPVVSPELADVAIIRAGAPFERPHPSYFFGSLQHEGRLDFRDSDEVLQIIKRASARVPTLVIIDLDRPAILTNIKPLASVMVATFGASDEAVIDVLAGHAFARGQLPFELPSTMSAVERQQADLPHDSDKPLYPFGFGLRIKLGGVAP